MDAMQKRKSAGYTAAFSVDFRSGSNPEYACFNYVSFWDLFCLVSYRLYYFFA